MMLDAGFRILDTSYSLLYTGFTVLKGRHVKALGKNPVKK